VVILPGSIPPPLLYFKTMRGAIGEWTLAIHALDSKGRFIAQNDVYLGKIAPDASAGTFWYVPKEFRPPSTKTQIGRTL
jgi:hypothetical protein